MKLTRTARNRLAAVIVCLAPLAAVAGGLADAWSRFDRTMATFDPIGAHVRKPIERAIPDLRFKGFVRQWSDALIDEDGMVGFRDQDFRFLQLQNLLELEMGYHIASGLDVNVVGHFLYDGVYDWQDADGLFADEIDRTAEVYHDRERILREAYVSYRTPRFDLKVGKQQIAWGKMDGQFIDVVNAMDRRESVQLETEDFEWRRLPTWMASNTFYFGQNSVQLLYIFDFEHDRLPLPGSPWASPLVPSPDAITDIVLEPHRPSGSDFDDHEYGLRFDRAQGALTYGFIYYYAWDKNAVEHVVGTEVSGGPDAPASATPARTAAPRRHYRRLRDDVYWRSVRHCAAVRLSCRGALHQWRTFRRFRQTRRGKRRRQRGWHRETRYAARSGSGRVRVTGTYDRDLSGLAVLHLRLERFPGAGLRRRHWR